MTDNEKKCPLCHSVVMYYGEGGYGKCTNNNCTFDQKIDGCDIRHCEEIHLNEEKDLYSAND